MNNAMIRTIAMNNEVRRGQPRTLKSALPLSKLKNGLPLSKLKSGLPLSTLKSGLPLSKLKSGLPLSKLKADYHCQNYKRTAAVNTKSGPPL